MCCDGTVDPTNPKCVRATAGSLFHVPLVEGGTTTAAVAELSDRGFTTVATVVRDGTTFVFVDTAGIRRKGKTKLMAEKMSVVMARRNIRISGCHDTTRSGSSKERVILRRI